MIEKLRPLLARKGRPRLYDAIHGNFSTDYDSSIAYKHYEELQREFREALEEAYALGLVEAAEALTAKACE